MTFPTQAQPARDAGKVSLRSDFADKAARETVAEFLARGGGVSRYGPGISGNVTPLPGRSLNAGYTAVPVCIGAQIDREGYFPDPPGAKLITVEEPDADIPGVTWRRTQVKWSSKSARGVYRWPVDPRPLPSMEAKPEYVQHATEELDAEGRNLGRPPDANVMRTDSGRKSRSRRAMVANDDALAETRRHGPSILDRLLDCRWITQAQYRVGQSLLADLTAAERHALMTTRAPRSDNDVADMRTFVSAGGMIRGLTNDPNGAGAIVAPNDEVPGSVNVLIREASACAERRRLDKAFRAVQGALQGAVNGWVVISAPTAPGPRWLILEGEGGQRIARRLPHSGHVWENGRPILQLRPTHMAVRRGIEPSADARHEYRWLCEVVRATVPAVRQPEPALVIAAPSSVMQLHPHVADRQPPNARHLAKYRAKRDAAREEAQRVFDRWRDNGLETMAPISWRFGQIPASYRPKRGLGDRTPPLGRLRYWLDAIAPAYTVTGFIAN